MVITVFFLKHKVISVTMVQKLRLYPVLQTAVSLNHPSLPLAQPGATPILYYTRGRERETL